MNPQTLNSPAINRKPLFIVGGIVAGIMLLFLVFALLSPKKGTLVITAPTSSPVNVTITGDLSENNYSKTVLIDAADTQTFPLKPGSYKVASTASTAKTIDVVTVAAEKETKLGISFEVASTATKLAGGLDFCPLIVQGKVYDYDCLSYGFVYEMNADETKSILFDSQWFDYLTAYSNGFIGLPVDSSLKYVDLITRQMSPITLPEELTGEEARSQIKVATPSDPTKTYFALSYAAEDAVYLYRNPADANPIKLSLPSADFLSRDGFMDSMSFTTENLVLYSGPIDESEENEGETSLGPPTVPKGGGKIVEYDLSGQVAKTTDTPKGFYPDNVYKLTDKYYVSDRIDGVEFFYLNGKNLESIHTMSEVVKSVTVGDKLYIQAESDIYVFKPGDAGSFSIKSTYTPADNETLNDIYSGPGYLVFTATPGDKEVSNVYRLTN